MSAGAHFTQNPIDYDIPISSGTTNAEIGLPSTANHMSIAPVTTAAKMEVQPVADKLVTTQMAMAASTTVQESSGKKSENALSDYQRIIVDLPSDCWSGGGKDANLIVFVPDRNKSTHFATRERMVQVEPGGEGVRVELTMDGISQEKMTAVQDIISGIASMSAEAFADSASDREEAKSYYTDEFTEKGGYWDLLAEGQPNLERIDWKRVSNKCENNHVGILVKDSSGNVSDKLTKIDYQSGNTNKQFQLVIEAAGSQVMTSDLTNNSGRLMVAGTSRDEDPFISNVNHKRVQPLEAANGNVAVALHDLSTLYSIIHLHEVLPKVMGQLKHKKDLVKKVTDELSAIDNDMTLSLGETISQSLRCLLQLSSSFGGNSQTWKLSTTTHHKGPRYYIPKVVHDAMVEQFNSRVAQHRVINNGSEFTISAELLSASPSVASHHETCKSVLLRLEMRGYYPKSGYCYAFLKK